MPAFDVMSTLDRQDTAPWLKDADFSRAPLFRLGGVSYMRDTHFNRDRAWRID
jgi:hypothetical protein